MPQMVWSTRPDGHHDYFNRRWYEFTGVPPGSTDGEGWNGIFHPADQAEAWQKWRQSLATGEPYEIEYRLRHRSGDYRWVLGRALAVRDDAGRIERWYGTCTDIDDLKRMKDDLDVSETRFSSLVDATASVVWSADVAGGLMPGQVRWMAYTGQAEEECVGWGWLTAVHPDDRSKTAQAWTRALKDHTLYQVEHRLRRHDGVYLSMLVRGTPIRLPGGRVGEWIGIHTDITDLKAAETALKRLNETLEQRVESRTIELVRARMALEESNRTLEASVAARTAELRDANEEIKRFAYIVSHDLRSPLVNIMGFTSELEAARDEVAAFYRRVKQEAPALATPGMDRLVETDFDEAIGFIRSSTEKMDRLINAILTLSRAEHRVLTAEPIEMRPFLQGFAGSLAHQLAERGAVLEVADVPDIVSDRFALEQVFANLLENAVKYLRDDRPGKVSITGEELDGRVAFTVRDNGRGIDPKDFERIFELFRRSGVQDRPGEGIGLAHVRALVRKLGGHVKVASVPAEGSTFTIDLPKSYRESVHS